MAYKHINAKGITYYLNAKEVVLRNHRLQRIYYFTKNERPETMLDDMPYGFEVVENEKTGLPVLRRF